MILKHQRVSVFLCIQEASTRKNKQQEIQPHHMYNMTCCQHTSKNNYRLKATLLGSNLLPDDGFI